MKLTTRHLESHCGGSAKQKRGFTLPELLIAIGLFIMLLGGIVSANLFGLSMFRITETKLNATADARHLLGTLANEIRSSKSVEIGTVKKVGTNGLSVVALLNGEKQKGNGLLIYPSTNTGIFITYFVEPLTQNFMRATSTPGSAVIIAEQVTNSVVFSAQDHLGTVLTNSQKQRVIHLNLEFYQAPRYMQVANYYKLETAVTRRASD